MTHRYKMDEIILALRKLESNFGNISKTSRETSIPSRTLRFWRTKYGIQPPAPLDMHRLRDRLIVESLNLASHIVEAVDDAPLNYRAAALNQMIDKIFQITEMLDGEDTDETEKVETLQIEFVDETGKISSTPPWAEEDSE